MKEEEIIQALRSSKTTGEELWAMRLKIAELIERYKDAYLNMREFAESKGLDTTTRN